MTTAKSGAHQFKLRFKGRTHLINKEGHLGVVKSTLVPIVKSEKTAEEAVSNGMQPTI